MIKTNNGTNNGRTELQTLNDWALALYRSDHPGSRQRDMLLHIFENDESMVASVQSRLLLNKKIEKIEKIEEGTVCSIYQYPLGINCTQ